MTRFRIGASVAFHASFALSLTAQEVYVNAGDIGQGVLRARLTECFVITPNHVVAKALDAIEIAGAAGMKRTAKLQTLFEPDFAILRVENPEGLECEAWLPPTNYDAMLKTQSAGYLSIREAEGSRTRMQVTFRSITENEILVRPTLASDQIRKSMSGASLLVNGALVGILLQRNEDGDGVVYQLDDIMRISEPWFKVVTSASREAARNANAFADNFETWFACYSPLCMLPRISSYADRVREIRIGEFPNQWERVVTPRPPTDPTARAVHAVTIRPGAKTIHAQVVFVDGTTSPVRAITIANSELMTGTRLSASGPRASLAPIVYVGVPAGGGSATIFPLAPPGTAVVRYAFDAGGFFDAQPMEGTSDVFSIEVPAGAPGVRLAFQRSDGTEVGPFEYSLGKISGLASESSIAALTASLPGSITCTRIPLNIKGIGTTAADTGEAALERATRTAMIVHGAITAAGLSAEMISETPATICAPPLMAPDYWAAAREIRFATSPGGPTTRMPMTAKMEPGARWFARLPATATAVYVRVEFINGTSSREFRLPIAEVAVR